MLTQESALRKDMTNGRGKTSFEHRHFAAIASWLRELGDSTTTYFFANKLADTNPRFDRARFLRACGL